MAGFAHAKIQRRIWTDPDFTALTGTAQRAYVMLCSHEHLSLAGHLIWSPRKLARRAADTTPDSIEQAIAELVAQHFVLVDDDTEELLIRTYIRHDGGWRTPNIHKAITSAVSRIESEALRAVAATELAACTKTASVQEPTDTTSEPIDEGITDLASSQQPAAQQPFHPAASSTNPSANGSAPSELDPAAAAVEILVTHRLTTERHVRDSARYAAKIRRDELAMHSAELAAISEDADPITVASTILGLTRAQAMTADYHRRHGAA